ncbi:SusD family protein [Algoriphagus locisalis]|uniref:SusD family protein n=1 Tax=Algoriphagus locisalis TaxID=305507 RepID=A0A1I6XVQ6_9BACT|nr:RagB/SusD family nutrient uptake outer membrane protein [Algoriphagus locisalis]SFT42207.1 SusD family protein [Algoriphagus locisalis]
MNKKYNYFGIWLSLAFLAFSCESYLDERPSKAIVVPQTLEDLESILNAVDVLNSGDGFGMLMSDDIYTTDNGWISWNEQTRNGYLWKSNLSNARGSLDSWSAPYSRIFRLNVVLDELEQFTPKTQAEKMKVDEIKATALFYRAYQYFDLLQLFSHPLIGSADLDRKAVPLKLSSKMDDIQGPVPSVQIYTRIIADLNSASQYLPEKSEDVLRPSKTACFGLLAKIYLQLKDYPMVLQHAEKALEIKPELLDFNTVEALVDVPLSRTQYPFPSFNQEVVIHIQAVSNTFQNSALTYVEKDIYDLFHENDIRKYLYFTAPDTEGNVNFIGHLTGTYLVFSGISVGELYLMKAEALARTEKLTEALAVINEFLSNRYFIDSYSPAVIQNEKELVEFILTERRKELVFRGLSRWRDMRRFLSDNDWEGPKARVIEGQRYELGKSPLRYMLEIPPNELELNSGF